MTLEVRPITSGQVLGYLQAVGDTSVSVGLVGLTSRCYRCGEQGVAIAGVVVPAIVVRALLSNDDDLFLYFESVGEALRDALDPVWLRQHFIGPLKVRRSRPRPEGYMSNGCHSCDAIIGSHPLCEAVEKIDLERLPEFVIRQVLLPLDAVRKAVESGKVQSEW
jgi:hypothetical protein